MHYESDLRKAVVATEPNTLAIHFRSDVLRRRSGQQWFHQSNEMLARTLAPVVSDAMSSAPLRLPSLGEVLDAEKLFASRCDLPWWGLLEAT